MSRPCPLRPKWVPSLLCGAFLGDSGSHWSFSFVLTSEHHIYKTFLAFTGIKVNFSSLSYKLCQGWALFGEVARGFSNSSTPGASTCLDTWQTLRKQELDLWGGTLIAFPGWSFISWCLGNEESWFQDRRWKKPGHPAPKEGMAQFSVLAESLTVRWQGQSLSSARHWLGIL